MKDNLSLGILMDCIINAIRISLNRVESYIESP